MAATITRPAVAAIRPGPRFGLIDHALAPIADTPDPGRLAQLELGLAVAVSAEALFTRTDPCGLEPEAAIASAVHTATTLTRAAIQERAWWSGLHHQEAPCLD